LKIDKNQIKTIAFEVGRELKNQNLIKDTMTPFERMEILLKNHNTLLNLKKEFEEKISEIEINGAPEKSHGIVRGIDSGSLDYQTKYDKTQIKLEYFRNKADKYNKAISLVDEALSCISKRDYPEIISMYFFDGLSIRKISETLKIKESETIKLKDEHIKTAAAMIFIEDIVK